MGGAAVQKVTQSPPKPQSKENALLQNELHACVLLLERFRIIREASGFGRIELAVHNGRVIKCEATVRDHLPADKTE